MYDTVLHVVVHVDVDVDVCTTIYILEVEACLSQSNQFDSKRESARFRNQHDRNLFFYCYCCCCYTISSLLFRHCHQNLPRSRTIQYRSTVAYKYLLLMCLLIVDTLRLLLLLLLRLRLLAVVYLQ